MQLDQSVLRMLCSASAKQVALAKRHHIAREQQRPFRLTMSAAVSINSKLKCPSTNVSTSKLTIVFSLGVVSKSSGKMAQTGEH